MVIEMLVVMRKAECKNNAASWKINALAVINGEKRQEEFWPPPSTPSAAGQSPAATVAAEPPDEPPDTLALSYGFRVALQI